MLYKSKDDRNGVRAGSSYELGEWHPDDPVTHNPRSGGDAHEREAAARAWLVDLLGQARVIVIEVVQLARLLIEPQRSRHIRKLAATRRREREPHQSHSFPAAGLRFEAMRAEERIAEEHVGIGRVVRQRAVAFLHDVALRDEVGDGRAPNGHLLKARLDPGGIRSAAFSSRIDLPGEMIDLVPVRGRSRRPRHRGQCLADFFPQGGDRSARLHVALALAGYNDFSQRNRDRIDRGVVSRRFAAAQGERC